MDNVSEFRHFFFEAALQFEAIVNSIPVDHDLGNDLSSGYVPVRDVKRRYGISLPFQSSIKFENEGVGSWMGFGKPQRALA